MGRIDDIAIEDIQIGDIVKYDGDSYIVVERETSCNDSYYNYIMVIKESVVGDDWDDRKVISISKALFRIYRTDIEYADEFYIIEKGKWKGKIHLFILFTKNTN